MTKEQTPTPKPKMAQGRKAGEPPQETSEEAAQRVLKENAALAKKILGQS